jgi:hypothetical protein
MEKGYMQEIAENFNKYRIGIDDTFAFKCRGCGKCCKNREDILLNSRDVYNIATALELSHKQVIEKYCEVYIGRDSRLPIVRLLPKGVNRVCPLLVGSHCSVHSLKPTVCALFPLGRVMASSEAPKEMGLGRPGEIEYILTSAPCGSHRIKQTVRAWLEKFNIPVEDEFFVHWNKAIFSLTTAIQKYEGVGKVTERTLNMLWNGICIALYLDYDTQKEFYAQFENNVAKILSVLESVEVML